MSCFSALIVVIGLAGLISGATIGGLIWFVLGTLSLINTMRSSYVEVDDSTVVVRSVLWPRRYALTDIRSAEVAAGSVGLVGYARTILVLNLVDGRRVNVTTLSEARSAAKSGRSTVTQAAEYINAAVG